ncbi:hypothetical protein E0K83_09905 [Gramella sp. BOM4]|nr:hypothetical protein [Christiangramia bathymodioli]
MILFSGLNWENWLKRITRIANTVGELSHWKHVPKVLPIHMRNQTLFLILKTPYSGGLTKTRINFNGDENYGKAPSFITAQDL